MLCGGNIDLTILDRVIEIGLVTDGRLARFTVSISDRPGGLARLASVIAGAGASIKEIVHDRAFSGPDLSAVRVVCVVETTGHDHVRKVHDALATRASASSAAPPRSATASAARSARGAALRRARTGVSRRTVSHRRRARRRRRAGAG